MNSVICCSKPLWHKSVLCCFGGEKTKVCFSENLNIHYGCLLHIAWFMNTFFSVRAFHLICWSSSQNGTEWFRLKKKNKKKRFKVYLYGGLGVTLTNNMKASTIPISELFNSNSIDINKEKHLIGRQRIGIGKCFFFMYNLNVLF